MKKKLKEDNSHTIQNSFSIIVEFYPARSVIPSNIYTRFQLDR